MNLNNIIDAILLNNPNAVNERLSQLGVIQEQYDPDGLKRIILDLSGQMPDDGKDFLSHVLDVPVNLDGYGAYELINSTNKIAIESLFKAPSTPPNKVQTDFGIELNWFTVFMVLVSVFILVLTIFLIKKI